jgi:hypothetical protein
MRHKKKLLVLSVALVMGACGGDATPGKPPGGARPAAAADGGARVETHGFHSAQFGMTEAQVSDSIVKDFHVAPSAIRAEENAEEKTHILAVDVPNVLPQGGTAEIVYVFGHSKTLIQIGITWSEKTDPALTAARLVTNAQRLAQHFKEAGYQPRSVATDVPLTDGMLVFRGTDKAGHATILVLHGEGADTARAATAPKALTLYYVADPEKPDVEASPPVSP